jgi:tetrahydromethanopterin S-methyltransferase subunit G
MYITQRAFSVASRQTCRAYTARATLPALRQLHASPAAFKTTTEKVAEVADKVRFTDSEINSTGKKTLTGVGIEKGQQVGWPRPGICHRYGRGNDRENEADSR